MYRGRDLHLCLVSLLLLLAVKGVSKRLLLGSNNGSSTLNNVLHSVISGNFPKFTYMFYLWKEYWFLNLLYIFKKIKIYNLKKHIQTNPNLCKNTVKINLETESNSFTQLLSSESLDSLSHDNTFQENAVQDWALTFVSCEISQQNI